MLDEPAPAEILSSVAAFLRGIGEATPHAAYQARVAANALDLVARHIELAPAAEGTELERLRALLSEGDLAELNARLAAGIADGSLDAHDPAIAARLRATTLAKLAIDQPGYSGYRMALAEKDA